MIVKYCPNSGGLSINNKRPLNIRTYLDRIANLFNDRLFLGRQPPVNIRHLQRQLAHFIDDSVVHRAVHVREVILCLGINSDTEGVNAAAFGLDERHACIFDAIGAAVGVVVVGLTIG